MLDITSVSLIDSWVRNAKPQSMFRHWYTFSLVKALNNSVLRQLDTEPQCGHVIVGDWTFNIFLHTTFVGSQYLRKGYYNKFIDLSNTIVVMVAYALVD